jgi:ankyrin repeat protein
MPRTLDETYDRVLSAIDDEYSDEAKTALYWLAFSARPITVAELAEACSIRIVHNAEPRLEDGGYEAITGLLEVISPFVIQGLPSGSRSSLARRPWPYKLDKASDRSVRLAHFSVKEYLTSTRLRDRALQFSKYWLEESNAHRVLGQMCSAYFLSFTSEARVKIWIDEESEERYISGGEFCAMAAPAFPLLGYARNHWYRHQKFAESLSTSLTEQERLHLQILENERVRVAWLRLLSRRAVRYNGVQYTSPYDHSGKLSWYDGTRALYWAVLLGLRETATLLCNREPRPDVNHVAGKYGFPLQAAAYSGENKVVSLLIDRGAIPNLEGGYYGTALQAAICAGEGIVSTLLQSAPECARMRNGGYRSALPAAIEGQDWKIVKNLLQAGADPNCPVKETVTFNFRQVEATDTLLLVAMRTRNVKVAQMMIQFGANIDLTSSKLLYESIGCESEELIRTLLQATSIDDSVLDKWLILAVDRAHTGIIRLLIDAGANPNSSSGVHEAGCHAMRRDAEKGKAAVELLIESGLKIAGDHRLLIATTLAGLNSMAESLLLSGADIHGQNKRFGDALMSASGCGNEYLVQILLGAGANTKAQHLHVWKAAWGYSEEPNMRLHSALVKAMIYGITGLDGAFHRTTNLDGVFQSSLAIAQQLIDAGVDVNDGGDALCEAIMCLYEQCSRLDLSDQMVKDHKRFVELMVQCLIANGADPDGPLGAIPSVMCASRSKDTTDLVLFMFQENHYYSRRSQLLRDMPQILEEKFDLYRRLVTSCIMVANDDTVMLLKEELKTKTPDLARVCELLSAACWSFRRPICWSKSDEKGDRLRHILQTIVDGMGPNHSLFDGVLTGNALERSMSLYIRQATPCEHSVTRVKTYLTDILSKSRPVSTDEIASAD